MSTITEVAAAPPAVRFARRQNRGLMLGLSTPRVVCLAAALAVLVAGLLGRRDVGAAVAGIVWAPLVGGAFLSVAGRPAVEWAPVVGQWSLAGGGWPDPLPGPGPHAAPVGHHGTSRRRRRAALPPRPRHSGRA